MFKQQGKGTGIWNEEKGLGNRTRRANSSLYSSPCAIRPQTKTPETGVSGASIVCSRRSSDHASSRSVFLTWLRVAPPPMSPGCAGDGRFEFPRAPHPSAPQVANPRVAPRLQLSCLASQCSLQVSLNPASSGSTGDGSSSFLALSILQRCLRPNLQVSLFPRLWLRLAMSPRVSPLPHLPGAGDGFVELPRAPHPSALLSSNLQVAPAILLKLRLR